MTGLVQHFVSSLRLHFRNRLALIYGYLFPVIFLAAFWVLYRHEAVPLVRHLGKLLTVTILGGACFGLPTTLVSERERGVWRRYRLLPVGTAGIVLSTVLARYVILLSAGLLQVLLALAMGMPAPDLPLELFIAFTFVAFAFIGLGLVIGMLADNVPAVQALGQCLFLPMLIIGGVAVPLASLPEWAQHVSAFFPGRYAVAAQQACVNGDGLGAIGFELLALALIGAAGFFGGTKLFRWDTGPRSRAASSLWLVPVFAIWAVVGLMAESRGKVMRDANSVPTLPTAQVHATPRQEGISIPAAIGRNALPLAKPISWEAVTPADVATIDFRLPPDAGIVTPVAGSGEQPDEELIPMLNRVREGLSTWPPAQVNDPVQRVRNLLSVAGTADLLEHPTEPHVPLIVLARLQSTYAREPLIKLLGWIALHPEEGTVPSDLAPLGLGPGGDSIVVRERMAVYALKFIARLNLQEPPPIAR